MADALIPGYSLPEHLKTAKQIIPVTIDQTFENNYYKNPDEVLAFTKTPEGKIFWQNGNDYDFQRPWHSVLIKEYLLNSDPIYITFTLFSFRLRPCYGKYYGVEYNRATSRYEKSIDSAKQYGCNIPYTGAPVDYKYLTYHEFDGGITSCEVIFGQSNGSNVVPLMPIFIDVGEPYIKFQVSGRKLSLFTRMDDIIHTNNQNNEPVIWLFYKERYIQMQGIISIF